VGYARRLPGLFAAEALLVSMAILCCVINAGDESRAAAFEFVPLCLVAVAYELWDVLLIDFRQRNPALATGAEWVARLRWNGRDLRALAATGQGLLSRSLSRLFQEAPGGTSRRGPVGASIAGGMVAVALLTTSTADAATVLLAPQPSELAVAPAVRTPVPPNTRNAVPAFPPAPPTYDDLCGRASPHPGDGAPDWAKLPLFRLWLGRGFGVGAEVGGCVTPARFVPGQRSEVYQVGRREGGIVAVGVCVRYGPTTLYLGSAAERVLRQIRRGVVVVGPNWAVVSMAEEHLVAPARIYVTGS
jgi:hypothetical protein